MLEIINHSDFQILHDAAAFILTLTNQIQHSYDDCLCCQSTLGTKRNISRNINESNACYNYYLALETFSNDNKREIIRNWSHFFYKKCSKTSVRATPMTAHYH